METLVSSMNAKMGAQCGHLGEGLLAFRTDVRAFARVRVLVVLKVFHCLETLATVRVRTFVLALVLELVHMNFVSISDRLECTAIEGAGKLAFFVFPPVVLTQLLIALKVSGALAWPLGQLAVNLFKMLMKL